MKEDAIEKENYFNDLKLIVKRIKSVQSKKFKQIKTENQSIISKVKNVEYVQKIGGN